MRNRHRVAAALICLPAMVLAGCGNGSGGGGSASTSAATNDYVGSDCAAIAPPTPAAAQPDGEATNGVIVQGTEAKAPTIFVSATATAPTQLVSQDLIQGSGAEVKPGATVTANYCGVGLTSRAIFDSSWARGGQPITFPLDQVIAGWTNGLPGMKVGGRRLLIIPGDQAYGPNPPPGSGIGANEALVFVVDLTATQ